MEHKFQVGDRIRFIDQDGIDEGIGTIAGIKTGHYQVFVECIIKPDRPVRLHSCGGTFETRDYWNVQKDRIVELLDSGECAEISPEDLEVLLNG